MVEIFAREEEEEEEEEEEQKESTPTLPRDGKSNDERPSMNSREESGRKDGRMEGRKEGRGEGTLFFFADKERKSECLLFFGAGGPLLLRSFFAKKRKRGTRVDDFDFAGQRAAPHEHPPTTYSLFLSLSLSLSLFCGRRAERGERVTMGGGLGTFFLSSSSSSFFFATCNSFFVSFPRYT